MTISTREETAEARTFEQMVTLASWLAEQDETMLHTLIQADRKSTRLNSSHWE